MTSKPARCDDRLRLSVWRWHFMAGVITLPFLLWLAITGSIYLFETEIELALHRPLLTVEAEGDRLPSSTLVMVAERQSEGSATALVTPETRSRSAEVVVALPSGDARSVFVNPYTGEVLGSLGADWRVTDLARRLHGLALLGPVANGLIEAVAGWVLILSATGLYLWWPRPGRGGAMTVRGSPRSRLFWRDLHAVLGVSVAVFGVFFALTGLLWSGVWGATVHEGLRRIGQGVPAEIWDAPPRSGGGSAPGPASHDEHAGHLAWAAQGLPERTSTPSSDGTVLTLGEAAMVAEARGISDGYRLAAPLQADGVYLASIIPDQASGIRVVQIDRFTGAVLNDFSYRDYGAAAQGIEWGVSVHMGKEYGRLNQWIMFAACLAIIALCVSALASWLIRRRAGEFGAPPHGSLRAGRTVMLIVLVGAALFPLTALSAVALALIDRWTQRRQHVADGLQD